MGMKVWLLALLIFVPKLSYGQGTHAWSRDYLCTTIGWACRL